MHHDPSLLIVTGASLDAETHDRPVAYLLRQHGAEALGTDEGHVVVCSDIWYLNQERLRTRPTISVGAPDVNALTAYFAGRLPTLLTIDDRLAIHGDPELVDLVLCCWGRTADDTRQAAALLIERYLGDFLRAVASAAP